MGGVFLGLAGAGGWMLGGVGGGFVVGGGDGVVGGDGGEKMCLGLEEGKEGLVVGGCR